MPTRNFNKKIEIILEQDKRYPVGAYVFVRMALDFSFKRLSQQNIDKNNTKHVSTAELLDGLKIFARETFGPMASVLFEEWNIKNTIDIGNIVFNMIQVGELVKSDDDKLEDFTNVFDLNKEFVQYYKA